MDKSRPGLLTNLLRSLRRLLPSRRVLPTPGSPGTLGELKSLLERLRPSITTHASTRGLEELDIGLAFSRQSSDTSRAWLGLNTTASTELGCVQILPFVGVSNEPLQRLSAELWGHPYNHLSAPSTVIQLGYLSPTPDLLRFTFYLSIDPEPVVDEMFESLDRLAEPVWSKLTTLDEIVKIWEQQPFSPYRFSADFEGLAIAYYLLGKHDQLQTHLRERRSQINGSSPAHKAAMAGLDKIQREIEKRMTAIP